MKQNKKLKKVLIYRLGSLGDTIVALPAFKLVRQAFPEAEIGLLTNFPVADKAAPIQTILQNTNLVQQYFSYPLKTYSFNGLSKIKGFVDGFAADILVYLNAPRGNFKAIRDWLFFKLCGIHKIVGLPWHPYLQRSLYNPQDQTYEFETLRILRCIKKLGNIDVSVPDTWNLNLIDSEWQKVNSVLQNWNWKGPFFCASLGTKMPAKFWGLNNWQEFFSRASEMSRLGLVLIGAPEEFEESEAGTRDWKGAKLNLCGTLSPRESFGLLTRAAFFVGQDSGPMHLAAAAQTKVFAIFSARNLPKVWYPFGEKHKIFYPEVPCKNCQFEVCPEKHHCIKQIGSAQVARDIIAWKKDHRNFASV
jgi:ADP-heptose:LPS heptosyltransferase